MKGDMVTRDRMIFFALITSCYIIVYTLFFDAKNQIRTKLGGDNFDGVIVKYLADNFEKTKNINLRTNNQALQGLTEAAEKTIKK
tara:strand:- start:40 stop:294 length:255 start_codon:yes stop_codon:yes gene_type:complete